MIDTELEQIQIWITEILEEASSYGLRNEVYDTAQSLIKSNPDMDIIEIYQIALNEWIK